MNSPSHKEPITILFSIYDFYPNEFSYDTDGYARRCSPKEYIYKAEIRDMTDFTRLWCRLDKKVKYKKPTDKNWYTYRSMLKRLFKEELSKRDNQAVFYMENLL